MPGPTAHQTLRWAFLCSAGALPPSGARSAPPAVRRLPGTRARRRTQRARSRQAARYVLRRFRPFFFVLYLIFYAHSEYTNAPVARARESAQTHVVSGSEGKTQRVRGPTSAPAQAHQIVMDLATPGIPGPGRASIAHALACLARHPTRHGVIVRRQFTGPRAPRYTPIPFRASCLVNALKLTLSPPRHLHVAPRRSKTTIHSRSTLLRHTFDSL